MINEVCLKLLDHVIGKSVTRDLQLEIYVKFCIVFFKRTGNMFW